jgi:uncharacterized membrane protein YqhA
MEIYFGIFLLFSGSTILPTIVNRITGFTYFDYNTTGWSTTFMSTSNTTWTNAAAMSGVDVVIILVPLFGVLFVVALIMVGMGRKELKEAKHK